MYACFCAFHPPVADRRGAVSHSSSRSTSGCLSARSRIRYVRTYVCMVAHAACVHVHSCLSAPCRAATRCDPCIAACCLLLGAVPRRLGCFVACRVGVLLGAVADLLVCVRSQASSFYAHCRMLTRSGWRSTATLMAGRPPPTAGPKSQCICGRDEPSPGADVAGVSAVLAQMWQG